MENIGLAVLNDLQQDAGQKYGLFGVAAALMYSYAARVPPRDRWAIAAYVRALQLSRSVNVANVPDAREKLP